MNISFELVLYGVRLNYIESVPCPRICSHLCHTRADVSILSSTGHHSAMSDRVRQYHGTRFLCHHFSTVQVSSFLSTSTSMIHDTPDSRVHVQYIVRVLVLDYISAVCICVDGV